MREMPTYSTIPPFLKTMIRWSIMIHRSLRNHRPPSPGRSKECFLGKILCASPKNAVPRGTRGLYFHQGSMAICQFAAKLRASLRDPSTLRCIVRVKKMLVRCSRQESVPEKHQQLVNLCICMHLLFCCISTLIAKISGKVSTKGFTCSLWQWMSSSVNQDEALKVCRSILSLRQIHSGWRDLTTSSMMCNCVKMADSCKDRDWTRNHGSSTLSDSIYVKLRDKFGWVKNYCPMFLIREVCLLFVTTRQGLIFRASSAGRHGAWRCGWGPSCRTHRKSDVSKNGEYVVYHQYQEMAIWITEKGDEQWETC